jgi:putrescine aminotransferase
VATENVFKSWFDNPFMHTTTFGGNPLACAAAIATIGVLLEEKLPERAAEVGEYFLKELKEAAKGQEDKVLEIRGQGLMIGIEFHQDEIGYEVSKGMFDHGILVAGTLINSKTIRIEPALTISYEDVDKVVSTFKQVLSQVKK